MFFLSDDAYVIFSQILCMFHIVCVCFFNLAFETCRDCETGQLQLMVNFVTKGDKKDLLQPLVDQITTSFPQVVSRGYFSLLAGFLSGAKWRSIL